MLNDLRHALRGFRLAPGFTTVAVLTLALGIGGATAIFSVVDGILLRPLPYPDPAGIVRLERVGETRVNDTLSAGNFLDLQRDATTLVHMAGYREDIVDVTGTGEPLRVPGVQTTVAFFELFGAQPVAGRFYGTGDRPGSGAVVISEGFWQRQFGGRREVVGTTIRVNGSPSQIVGVAPAAFRHPLKADLWLLAPDVVPSSPIPLDGGLADRNVGYFGAVARVAPGASLADANAQLDSLGRRLAEAFPDPNGGESYRARRLGEVLVVDVRAGLLVLLGAVGFVLLIACANVAGLLLTRSLARRREFAVRASLGASRRRLVMQLITESLLLALAGGAAGLLVAAWALDLLVAVAPDLPRLDEVQLDWRVALVAFAVTTMVGLLAGAVPAWQSSRPHLNEDLKDGGRTGTSARTRVRNTLVVAEVALALVLLIGAGLMATSLSRLSAVDPGFQTAQVMTVALPVPQARYDEAAQRRFYRDILARVQSQPATAQAAIVFPTPLGGSTASAGIEIEGVPQDPNRESLLAELNAVSPGYFTTVGMRLLRGRTFTPSDVDGQPAVGMVNERLAREFGGDPIGKRINLGSWVTIVGVVSDARRKSLATPPQPAVYLPSEQFVLPFMSIVVRTEAPPSAVAGAVRAAVRELDPDLPVDSPRTMEQIMDASTGQPRFRTGILLAFAALAVTLAAIGVYGLMSFAVSQRQAEMGVRLALGASPRQVGALVLRQGLALAGTGVLLGVAASLAFSRWVASMLYDTSVTEPTVFAGLAMLLLTIAALACYVPARRAMRVDPVRALRAD